MDRRAKIELLEQIRRGHATDQRAPRKQHHTAHRIWVRLKQEKSEIPIGEGFASAQHADVNVEEGGRGIISSFR